MRSLLAHADHALGEGERALSGISDPVARRGWVKAYTHRDPGIQAAGRVALTGEVVAHAVEGLISGVGDPRATPALRSAVVHRRPGIRRAAVTALGFSGNEGDVPLIVERLADSDEQVRMAACGSLAELGGQAGADALAEHVDRSGGVERSSALAALVWLRDPRALAAARRLVTEAEGELDQEAAWALVRIGNEHDLAALKARVVEDLRRDERNAHIGLAWALEREGEDPRPLAAECLLAAGVGPTRPVAASESVGLPRTVSRITMAALSEAPCSDDWPPPKFGGQPDWVSEPTWPIASNGRPLLFYGQLPLPGSPRRTAYVFINTAEDARTWEPLQDGNAVVVQPGPPPHLRTTASATGPQRYERVRDESRYRGFTRPRPFQRYVDLQPGRDPPEWVRSQPLEQGDWCKIGGTPLFLQSAHTPPGDGWQYAFQFSASWAGRELADGAVCYAFVRDDGGAAMTWDCH